MSFKARWYKDKLAKKCAKGFRGYPVATIAYYGPDSKRASKVVVGIVVDEEADAEPLERWYSDTADVRADPHITEAMVRFIEANEARTVLSQNAILGCPHEEGIDYPEGQACPRCPFWEHRDRFGSLET
jgi:hypothetical protein